MNISSLAHNPILSWNRVSGKPGAVHFGALIFILGTLLAVNWVGFGEPKTAEKESIDRISDPVKSSNAEAQALFHQALTVLMLPEDEARLNSSLSLFQRVIEIDPDFPGGFAGKSIALSFKVLFIKANDPSRDLEEVTDLAERAVDQAFRLSVG